MKPVPHVAVDPAQRCDSDLRSRTGLQSTIAQRDLSLAEGPTTLDQLNVFRKVVVLINDFYFDPQRIRPARMLEAMAASIVQASDGALTSDGRTLVAADGARWPFPEADSILVPAAVFDSARDHPVIVEGSPQEQEHAEAFSAMAFESRTLRGGVLEMRVGPMLKQTPELMRAALERASGAGVAGVILDLRGNIGGFFEAAKKIA